MKPNNEMFDFQTVNDLEHDNQKYESNVRNKIDNINKIANIRMSDFIYRGETITIPESERSQGFDEFTVKFGKTVTGRRAVYFKFTVRNYEPTDPSIAVFAEFMFR